MARGQKPLGSQDAILHPNLAQGMMAVESTLFKTQFVNQPVEVLLLVENSQAMSFIWDDLRDRFLVKLMDRLKEATLSTAGTANVWVLESQPLQASSTQPRKYCDPDQALRDVCLNYMSENRISASKINMAIDFLTSLTYNREFYGGLHLIIVAASSPIDSPEASLMDGLPVEDRLPWHALAGKMAQANIYCHTLTRSNEDMGAFTVLFNESLRLNHFLEDMVTFAPDSEVSLRLAMAPVLSNNVHGYGQLNSLPRPMRITMPPRRNTFPIDVGFAGPSTPYHEEPQPGARPPDMEVPPSLVTQLQQVHGLTKKKVYGAKPQRKPFFKNERVGDPSDTAYAYGARPSTPSSGYLPEGARQQQHSMEAHTGGRMISLSRIDRRSRIQESNSTDAHLRRYGWGGPSSRLTSPDPVADQIVAQTPPAFNDISPTTSYISSDLSSPVSPVSVEDYYSFQPNQAAMNPMIVSGGQSDPSWLQPGYPSTYIASNGHVGVMQQQQQAYAALHGPLPTYQDVTGQIYSPYADVRGAQDIMLPEHGFPDQPKLPPSSGGPPVGLAPVLPAQSIEAVRSPRAAETPAAPPPSAPSPHQKNKKVDNVPSASHRKSAKKAASQKAEDEEEEYIDISQEEIAATTKRFYEAFPQEIGKVPVLAQARNAPAATSGTGPASASPGGTSSGQAHGQTLASLPLPPASTTSPPSATHPGPPATKSSTNPKTAAAAATAKAARRLSSASTSVPSPSNSPAVKHYMPPSLVASPLGFQEPFAAVLPGGQQPPALLPLQGGYNVTTNPATMADHDTLAGNDIGHRHHHLQLPVMPPLDPYQTPPAPVYQYRGTSSLTGWAG